MILMIMKQSKLITVSLALLIMSYGKAQKNTVDTLLWDNGNYTLVSELGKVWIREYNDRKHKDVKIHTLDIVAGKIEYFYEGTFHDVLISNIERITPGKFYNNAIFFNKNNVPVVKTMMEDGITYDNGSFKSHQKPKPVILAEVVVEKPVITKTVAPTHSNTTQQKVENTQVVYDEIIFYNGKKILVKILSITDGKVHYKRSDILSGPIYIISLTIPGTLKKARVIPNNGRKTIDYRN
ncbi:MAG: hypothetical protein KBG47_04500 [Bacteroidia bacterium]|nr:hypothetical protein [Sphingobacteriaceae bacterium]MBP9068743.1 hypothetical protein [Bacteroidia bacterium]